MNKINKAQFKNTSKDKNPYSHSINKCTNLNTIKQTKIPKEKGENKPNAKKKVKMAEKMLPMMAETAKLQASFTLSTKSPKKGNGDIAKRERYR